ncbi:DUF1993 domain-containing protein [Citromicrobium bathyomarinum]
MTPTELLTPTYIQMLGALSQWLDKASAQLGASDAEALLSARLAPDMFPLATQLRFACVQAIEGMHRLRDEPFPPVIDELLDEGRNAGEAPGSLADAEARLQQTIAMVRSLAEGAEQTDADRMIAHALPTGMIFDLTVDQYARDWALAQFYFHLMAAYAILRSKGVDLGKADYVAHMFGYLRPGTMPA